MKEFYLNFLKSTSLNGIYFIYSSKNLIRKLCWISVFIGVCLGLVYHLYMLSNRYANFEIQTTLRLDIPQSLPFPSVTVCNLSPIDKSKLTNSTFIKALLALENEEIYDENGEVIKNFRYSNCIRNESAVVSGGEASYNFSVCYYLDNIVNFLKTSNTSDLTDLRDQMQLEWDDFYNGAHSLEDFVVYCTYDHRECGEMYRVDSYYSSRYGRCYTYGNLMDARLKATKPGDKGGGLELVLNVNSENYIGLLTPETGVKVAITDPDLQPLPDVDGILASPGTTTMVALKRKETKRLKAPYKSDCMDSYPDQLIPILAEATLKYSDILCQKACRDLYANKSCGCFESLDTPEAAGVTCTPMFVANEWSCLSKLFRINESNSPYEKFQQENCNCKVACNTVSFDKMISQAPWPTKAHQSVLSRMSKNKKLKALMKSSSEHVRKNLVHIHVFYETFNVDVVEETADYSLTSLFSDVGGITGLYLGMSIVTVFELLECLCTTVKTLLVLKITKWKKELIPSDGPSYLKTIDLRQSSASLINLTFLETRSTRI